MLSSTHSRSMAAANGMVGGMDLEPLRQVIAEQSIQSLAIIIIENFPLTKENCG